MTKSVDRHIRTSQSTSSLYHYTSFDALIGMLKDEYTKKKNMNLWFGNPLQTNDKKEILFYEEYVFANKSGDILHKEIDKLKDDVGRPFIFSMVGHRETIKSYPSCEIPMWKMYGNDFCGVRLRFKFEDIKKYCEDTENTDLYPCYYLTKEEMKKEGREIRNSVKVDTDGTKTNLERLYKNSVLYKTCDWIYENEWRIVMWEKNVTKMAFKPNGRLYRAVTIPLDLLKEIEIGPKADQKAIESSLDLLNAKINYEVNIDFKIVKSKLEIGYL